MKSLQVIQQPGGGTFKNNPQLGYLLILVGGSCYKMEKVAKCVSKYQER